MYAGSTPATPMETIRASGSAPIASTRSPEAITRQAAPSLSVDALPAVTVPPSRKAGRSVASFSSEVSARGPSSISTATGSPRRSGSRRLHGDHLLGEPALAGGVHSARMALQREAVLLGAGDLVSLGDVLGGLAHGLGRVALGHPGVDQAPAERGVVHGLRPAGQSGLGLQDHPRRAAHGLGAPGHVQVALTEAQGPRGLVDRLEPGGAEAVDGNSGDLDRKPGEERRHAPRVAVVLARLVRGSPVDVADGLGVEARALDRGPDGLGGKVVGPHTREDAAVAPHRRAHGVDDESVGHSGEGASGPENWLVRFL